MHCHRPPEPAHAVTALVRGEHPLQGTEGRSEAGHHPFQRKSIEVLVLNTQRVCQVSILLLYYCKFHPRGLQSLADLTFCSHVLSLTCDPSSPPEPSHAVTAAWCTGVCWGVLAYEHKEVSMRELRCSDVGFDCDAVVKAQTEDEILEQAADHAQANHGGTVTPDMATEIRTKIRDSSSSAT